MARPPKHNIKLTIDQAVAVAGEKDQKTKAAIRVILAEQKRLAAALVKLGHVSDSTVEAAPAVVKTRKSGVKRTKDPNAPCGVCGFATTPPHDGRSHRHQGKTKKPFGEAELAELKWKKK